MGQKVLMCGQHYSSGYIFLPGGRIPKIAVAEMWPSSFRAMHLYVPESIWLASSICSQLESSYFWGPPRDYRKTEMENAMERL